MKKRELLARVMSRLGILQLLETVRSLPFRRNHLTVLTYHRVADIDSSTYPFDSDIISTDTVGFEKQIALLCRYYQPITFATLHRHMHEGAPLPPEPLIITFDDGYSDVYRNALPILKRYGVPATVFLITDSIGTSAPFWFERVAYLIKRTTAHQVTLPALGIQISPLTPANRQSACQMILGRLKAVPDTLRIEALEQLDSLLPISIPEDASALVRPLSWSEARELHREGIELGSHTATHPILSRLAQGSLEAEITGSRRRIAEEIGAEPLTLAYPVGVPGAFDERVMTATARAGYSFAVTAVRGVNHSSRLKPYELRRMGIDHSMNLNLLRCRCLAPSVFARY